MSESFDVTTIIFAALALFVVWKLRSVLGTRTGHEHSRDGLPGKGRGPAGASDDSKVVRLPGGAPDRRPPSSARPQRDENRWKGLAEPGSKVWDGLDQIAATDPSFDGTGFRDGAKAAYEMIITAFARGDRQTLSNLLSKEVFETFSQAIADREARGNRVDTTFVSIEKADITDAQLRGKSAQITVSFVSKLITATFDRNDALIEGNPDKVVDVTDVWTFARDTGSRGPNWFLVAT